MFVRYTAFLKGVSVNRVGRAGVILTTASLVSFVFFEILHTMGVIVNAYFGLITYLAFPVLFVVGLILVPVGWLKYKKTTGKTNKELLSGKFNKQDISTAPAGSRLFRTVLVLTVINIVVLSIASFRMLHFMDQAEFCGTACHTVMNPEWVTYQKSPHARVLCVECHVGQGLEALVKSKLNGIRQMYLAALRVYNTPIPTPVHQLRPARETCEKCHWPEKFFGSRLKTTVTYRTDSLSTAGYTTLNVKIDAGLAGHTAGAHWHIAQAHRVNYTSVADQREQMITVRSLQPDGTFREFTNNRLLDFKTENGDERTMDCIDCHNRATHIYKNMEMAIDHAIRAGKISRELPYIKQRALSVLNNRYPSHQAARRSIRAGMAGFYSKWDRENNKKMHTALEHAIDCLQDIYITNVHPSMKIYWQTYKSFAGHYGCFRCHNAHLVDNDGKTIRHDCTLCHSILARDGDHPYFYLINSAGTEKLLFDYYKKEFLQSGY